MQDELVRSSWGFIAAVGSSDIGLILLILALVAFAAAVWRATQRDTLSTILCAGVGLVLLILAL